MEIDVRERMRIMENLKIAVLAVQPSQAIERNILSRFERDALTVRVALLAVLAVRPAPFAWTGKANRWLYVLCVRRRVRVSSIKSSLGKVHHLKSDLQADCLCPAFRQTLPERECRYMRCHLSEFAETDA
jgi:hypothetical protein